MGALCGFGSTKDEISVGKRERREWKVQVIQVIRHDMRELFGLEMMDKWGFFIDMNMSRQIHAFLPFSPKGDRVLQGHSDAVLSAVVSTDGSYLFTGSEDRTIIKWDLITLRVQTMIEAHKEPVLCLFHIPGMLISGGQDTMIRMWDDSTLTLTHEFEGHNDAVVCLDLDLERNLLLSASWDKTVKLWSLDEMKAVMTFSQHIFALSAAHFIDDSVISGGFDACIRVWNPKSGKEEMNIEDEIFLIEDVSINCDGSLVACVCGITIILEWPSMHIIRKIEPDSDDSECAVFHPNNPNIIAIGHGNVMKSVEIWNVRMKKCIVDWKGHTEPVRQLCFTGDGSRLISVSSDHTTRIWDVSSLSF